jgi:hypothetical protein
LPGGAPPEGTGTARPEYHQPYFFKESSMRTYSKIATAVAVALGSSSAFAAGATWTVSLDIAGSSAMRDAVTTELQAKLCNSDFTLYTSTQGTTGGSGTSLGENPDFKAVTCTLNAASGLSGTGAIVYYRSEGGSIFGVFGNAALNGGTSVQINRLNIGTSGAVNASPYTVFETVAQMTSDTQTGAVTKDVVQLGVSDVEPGAFNGENYGSEYSFIPYAQPTVSTLQGLPSAPMVGQVFAPITSNSGGSSVFTNASGIGTTGLTSTELAAIFNGAVTDWSAVPSAIDAGTTGGTITVCRRDAVSGTQTIASTHFLGTTCSKGGKPFAAAGAHVVTNFATGDVLTCVKNNPGAIGIVTLQVASKYTGNSATQVTVGGIQGNAINAASGKYDYYGEVYSVSNTAALTGNASVLANKIVTDLRSANNTPASASVPNLVALPKYNTPFYPVTPFGSGQQIPIGVATTSGNTCAPMADIL